MTVTRYAILGLLRERPSYPYALHRLFEQRIGVIWNLHRSTVAQTLKQLVREGLVEAQDRRMTAAGSHESTVYAVTEEGEREFCYWYQGLGTKAGPQRDELMVKVALAREEDTDLIQRLIDRREHEVEEELRAYGDLNGKIAAAVRAHQLDTLLALLNLNRIATHAECELNWLRDTRKTLAEYSSRARAQPRRHSRAGELRRVASPQ